MKLWIKLSVFIIILINIVIEVAVLVIRPEIKNFSISLLGEKLKSTAAASAASISGDEYEKLNFADSTVTAKAAFQNIRKHLKMVKTNLQLKEDIYTLSPVSANVAIFGIMTNQKVYTGDTLHLKNSIARTALNKAYNENKCIYTDLYEDQYGTWLTGIAPILNKNNKVVGVVQVDNSISTVQVMLSKIDNSTFLIRIVLIPLTMILSIIIAWLFTKPLEEAVKRINKISLGDYSGNSKIKTSGELKRLMLVAENLRTTILEQQRKIFATIEELEKAKNKAEASDRMKGEFLSVLSHEIRTPLNIILGNLSVMHYEIDDKMSTEIDNIIEAIKRGSERLIRTVEMMVVYSELASDNYTKKIVVIDAHDTLCEMAENYKHKSLLENVQLKLNCLANTVHIKADKQLFEEALRQILDNAVKFTRQGVISLEMVNNENGICIVVEDTGIGISDEFLPVIFKPFRQENMSSTRPYDGIGLGLSLAKRCCEYNGFDLRIESEKNKGTRVLIHIGKEFLL
ncbi:MAG: HAMP domain-containing histidine kinase [Ignavibacteriales bacterium]|nr:HAMP domain-containing histidine kinase [Ignavibacteriales bacterium]